MSKLRLISFISFVFLFLTNEAFPAKSMKSSAAKYKHPISQEVNSEDPTGLNLNAQEPNEELDVGRDPVLMKDKPKGLSLNPYIGLILGADIAKIGKDQTDMTAGAVNAYTQYLPTSNYGSSLLYGISGGYEFRLNKDLLLSLGLGFYQMSTAHAKGQVWSIYSPDPTQNSNIFDYEYKIYSTRLMLETQLSWIIQTEERKLVPFALLGIGPSLNFANGYQESVVDPSQSLQASFQNNSDVKFSYQVGLGIACPFNNDYDRFAIAYRYVDLGGVSFGSRGISPYQLEVGHITTNEVYISYTHLFSF